YLIVLVRDWFANRWRNHRSKRAEKPHSITHCFRKADCCPALLRGRKLRLRDPWRQEVGSPGRGAKCQRGKEVRTPIPHLVPARTKARVGTLCFIIVILLS